MTDQYKDINPEDIFLDSENLPGFDTERFQGRIEEPIRDRTFFLFKCTMALLAILLIGKLVHLQVVQGHSFSEISENNRLAHGLIFANRGLILDRNGVELATNAVKEEAAEFAGRHYSSIEGVAHVVGYVKYPSKDKAGFYYDEAYRGRDGAERVYDAVLAGKNGLKIRETDALGELISESVIEKPKDGQALALSLDAPLTQSMYQAIRSLAESKGFKGGAGAIMDVGTGEILALTSFPEYDPQVMTEGKDAAKIKEFLNSPSTPLLNRAVGGLYTPGSIVKPIVALGALNENLISPDKEIHSPGFISIPNPYNPAKPSVFKDWRAHGWTDMRRALAVSSDVYFYAVGGGYKDQPGLGITRLDKYYNLFGYGTQTGIDLPGENAGVIPNPAWKAEKFDGDEWRLGDTYITAIGQFGLQVTPLEALRATAALANGGRLLVPSILLGGPEGQESGASKPKVSGIIGLPEEHFKIVREGMRESVTDATAQALNVSAVKVAAKTGTAELGVRKDRVNSWVTGFFPYERPRYAFVVMMESGPVENLTGAPFVMRQVLDWMIANRPEYLE